MSPSMTDPKCDVFISYARADYKDENNKPIPNNVISKITSAFKENNISYWIDEDGIYTGDNFAKIIAKAIKNASVFVFVSTENSNASLWAQNEVCVAREYKKPILPIKCDESIYADSVIMYLQSLDYCDYKSHPKTAINQLVQSVKEKLPVTNPSKEGHQPKGDSSYKENVILSLSLINDQIIDISQIAVNRILESNERNIMRLHDIANEGITRLSENDNQCIQTLEKSLHYHLEQINSNTKDDLREIVAYLQRITRHMEDTHDEISKLHHVYSEQQKKTNDLLEQLTLIYSELSHRNHKLEKEKSQDDIEPNISKKRIANLFFVIDVSGSMAGDRITGLNTAMRRFISNFRNNHPITEDAEVHLSVITYSTNAQWQYGTPINIDRYKWIDLEAGGLTNFGNALTLLDEGIQDIANTDITPLVVFITDGTPTDSFEKKYTLLLSNPGFKPARCFCVSIGPDAHKIEGTNELKVKDITKLHNEFDAITRIYLDISGIAKY